MQVKRIEAACQGLIDNAKRTLGLRMEARASVWAMKLSTRLLFDTIKHAALFALRAAPPKLDASRD
jgi:hypothetical protein